MWEMKRLITIMKKQINTNVIQEQTWLGWKGEPQGIKQETEIIP